MALKPINKDFGNKTREVRYLNKDFTQWKQNLINFAKVYFPNSYKDFNESSPGMMFIEQASYVGDVLSYYLDNQLKESLMVHASERKNVISLAEFLGYIPKNVTPAITTLDVFQIIPSTGVASTNQPDYKFALKIKEGMQINSTTQDDISFRTTSLIDFGDTNDTDITVYERNTTTGEPTFYLLKKQVECQAGKITEITSTFSTPEDFASLTISDTDLISITDVRDSNNNKWYEVPYLAQDSVMVEVANTALTNPDLAQFASTVPYLIKLLQTSKRFVRRLQQDGTTTLEFGAGTSTSDDEFIIPNPNNTLTHDLEVAIDPANFLETKAYGEAPSDTTLTVKYITGGGVTSNVAQGDLTTISQIEFEGDDLSLSNSERSLLSELKNSIAVINDEAATGGRGEETIEEIRQNALAYFAAQNRAVTAQDYNVRVLSMPAKFGNVAKAFVIQDGQLDISTPDVTLGNKPNSNEKNNPFAINLYTLGYDSNKNLTPLNTAVKENIKQYLNQYRMLTDGINILDGFIINIGVDFQIIVFPDYNKKEVLLQCVEKIKTYFDIDKWQFNQPINLSELELLIANVEGVSAVPKVEIVNYCGGQYAPNKYNIEEAIKDKIIYPSLDPSMWEIKFKNKILEEGHYND